MKATLLIAQCLPKLATSEDDDQQHELECLKRADTFATSLIVGGPLLNTVLAGDPTETRLMEAITRLSKADTPTIGPLLDRELWAYRVGLVTGLRLARAVGEAWE